MRILKTILLRLFALIVSIGLLIAGVQTYYHFTPTALSPLVAEINARAALLPTLTENGFRLSGLLSSKSGDPVEHGRCLKRANDAQRREREQPTAPRPPWPDDAKAFKQYWEADAVRGEALIAPCFTANDRLTLPKTLTDVPIRLGADATVWQTLAAVELDPVLVSRAETVWANGPRRLGGEIQDALPPISPLLSIERWRIARAVQQWHAGERAAATAAWQRSTADWMNSADDTLVDAMLSIVVVQQVLIAMQQSAANADRLDDMTANSMAMAMQPIKHFPEAISTALLAEWQQVSAMIKQLDLGSSAITSGGLLPSNPIADALSRVTFERNDTLNRLASTHLKYQAEVLSAARGQTVATTDVERDVAADAFGCTALGDWAPVCMPFLRNSTGRILVAIGGPQYGAYGVRGADLRNLAAATRLTIEARRRALFGDALVRFIANAPEDMRDVFSGNAFVYDVASKCLRIELREKSTILGEKGATYELRL